MSSVAVVANSLRTRVHGANVSLREIARRACVSISTVRRFADVGTARVATLVKIEAAIDSLDSLDNPKGASARSDIHV